MPECKKTQQTRYRARMKLDDVLEEIGGFGPYQKWILFLTCLPNFLAGLFVLNPVFLLGIPDHRCMIPGYENDTYKQQSDGHGVLIDKYIPPSTVEGQLYDRCKVFEYLNEGSTSSWNSNSTDRQEVGCNKWVYDETLFKKTFASQVDLVCDKEIWVANAEMIFYAGMLLGSLVSGIAADRYGRKPVMCTAVLTMTVSSIGLSWAHEYWLFCSIEFILGGAIVSSFMPAYILAIEFTSDKKRVWPGVISDFPYVTGVVLLAAIAYGLRDWYKIQLYTSLPGVLFVFYWWLVPESPRWLLTKGRVKEADIIIRRVARWNKATVPEHLFDEKSVEDDTDNNGSFLQLFSTKTLCFRTLLIFFNWMVVNMVYFGLALNSENLNGNLYLNFGLSGLTEFPALIIVILLVDRVGRRLLFCCCMIVGGVACASTIFTIEYELEGFTCWLVCLTYPTWVNIADYIHLSDSDVNNCCWSVRYTCLVITVLITVITRHVYRTELFTSELEIGTLTIVLAMIGRLCVTGAYAVSYIHSAELFPTVVRNSGMGGASLFAGVGTMIAPYIVTMGEYLGGTLGEALPLLIFGGMAFLSGILSLLLPETLNKHLPETVQDGERFGRSGVFHFGRSLKLHEREQADNSTKSESDEHELLLSTDKKTYT